MNDLLPCPFCGGEAHIDGTTWRGSDGKDTAWVSCKTCNAYGPTVLLAECAAAWNRRVTPDPLLDASLRMREATMPDARGMVPVRKGEEG